jgi:hypothetical protein
MTEREQGDKIALELVNLKDRCFRHGFLRTGHALDKAVQEIGWELAIRLDPNQEKVRERWMKERTP